MERPLSASQFDSASVISVLRNLKIDCSSNTQVIVRSGTSVGSDDGKKVLTLTGDKTLDITTSGVNGLDTGAEAGNTWYYVYLIWNPTTALVNGLLSASATAPTLPSGYTKKRLIGAVRNDGSSNFLRFKQVCNRCYYSDSVPQRILTGGTATSFTSVSVASYIPTTVSYEGMFSLGNQGGTGTSFLGYDGTNWLAATNPAPNSGWEVNNIVIPHNSGNVYYYTNTAATIWVFGFVLDL